MTTKVCLRCRKELPIKEFEQLKVLDSRGGYSDYCHDCIQLNREEFRKNPPRWHKQSKKNLYGRK